MRAPGRSASRNLEGSPSGPHPNPLPLRQERGADRAIDEVERAAPLPRLNGELVFQAPWEGRAFGLAVSLYDAGSFEWREFAEQLSFEIAAEGDAGGPETYYERWVAAVERLATDKGLVTPDEIEARAAEFESGQRE